MSLKQEIETWVAALAAYDANEFEVALKTFTHIADTSKILFNCGVIHATLGEHEKAVDYYQRAVALDAYLAVAYFQQGVSNFLMGDFEEALANFNDTLLYLRGNNNIDYQQLGLKFKLYSCEVLFNRGLCYIYLQQAQAGMQDLTYAAKEKVVADHDVIDEAIREHAEGYTVFSIPVGVVYRPNEAKVKNLAAKDYLGKARLVAATDRSNAFTGFTGAELQNRIRAAHAGLDDRDAHKISYAATNLVKPNLTSRTRQQSEPPIGRNVFPPTPPPETDVRPPPIPDKDAARRGSPTPRGEAVRNGGVPKSMAPLDLSVAGFEKQQQQQQPRLGTVRSASERPRGTRDRELDRRSAASDQHHRRNQQPQTLQERRQEQKRRQQQQQQQRDDTDDLVDMYGARARPSNKIAYIEEEAGEDGDRSSYDGSYIDDHDDGAEQFEIVSASQHGQRRHRARRSEDQPPPTASTVASSHRSTTTTPSMRRIRVKVRASDDTRYVLVGPAVEWRDFAEQVRKKFGLPPSGKWRLKVRDEVGDFVTMGDQDDLDMAVEGARQGAKRERAEMGKMEVWLQEVS